MPRPSVADVDEVDVAVDERIEIIERGRRLLRKERFAALATHADGQSYATLVAFAASLDLRRLVFATMRASRKFANLIAEPRVALLIDNRSNEETDLQEAIAITATGQATAVDGAERAVLQALLIERHPSLAGFVSSPGCAIVRVDVEAYHTVTRFQTVDEFHPGTGNGVGTAQDPAPADLS